MKLRGLSLETIYFEDYLSFLTEVLELELEELTDISMRLDLQGTWVEIKKVPEVLHAKHSVSLASNVEFLLSGDEFHDLQSKLTFFYYRRDSSRFLFLGSDPERCELVDPDGRVWRFKNDDHGVAFPLLTPENFVRNF